jgi:putative phosphoesterase
VKLACISDIHGNYEALLAVIQDIEKKGIDFILCAGDIIGYYPNPINCIKTTKKRCTHIIRGNHDDVVTATDFKKNLKWFNSSAAKSLTWTRKLLTQPDFFSYFTFLKDLPTQKEIILEGKKILLAHGTPDKSWEYFIYPFWGDTPPFEYEIRLNRWLKTWDVVIIGHTHQAYVYTDKSNAKVVLNPGSVGQPRDYDSKASYAIVKLDNSGIKAQIIRIEYDISQVCKRLREAFLDDYLCERLYIGR